MEKEGNRSVLTFTLDIWNDRNAVYHGTFLDQSKQELIAHGYFAGIATYLAQNVVLTGDLFGAPGPQAISEIDVVDGSNHSIFESFVFNSHWTDKCGRNWLFPISLYLPFLLCILKI